jgi:hypothetical protein
MEALELTKVKYTHSGDNIEKPPLNIDLEINNERQDCKIGTVWTGTCGRGEGEQRR